MTVFLTLVIVILIGGLMFELREHRAEHLEQLNRESWEVLQTARRIHDETAEAIQLMLEEAREQTRARLSHEIGK
ncbi:MAG: hypothetical protein ABSB96_05190 [Gaiellaceae bacterium]